jgi:DNA-binding transcriptional ArsR family regulator
MPGGQCSFNWDSLIQLTVHPMKVAIIEAMVWIELPLSPKELDRMFDEQFGVSLVSYHMRTLAGAGVVEKVRQQSVRGALQSFYRLAAKEPANPSLHCE